MHYTYINRSEIDKKIMCTCTSVIITKKEEGKMAIILSVTLAIAYLILVSIYNGTKMSPKRRTLLSLVFACTC